MKIHPLLPILLILAAHMGIRREALALLPALLGHEAAHVLAAKAVGMRVAEMELTPMGAAARMESPWNASALRVVLVAMAGPAANVLMICVASAAAYALWLDPDWAWLLIRSNLLLMLVNLLPALPLDGGRALCALLSGRMGVLRAVRLGVWLGYGLALLIGCLAVWIGLKRGIWNIALLVAAAYICACASGETDAAASASAEGLVCRREELRRRGALPVRTIAVPADISIAEAMGLVRPGKVHVFALYDDAMRHVGTLQERDMMKSFPAAASEPLLKICTEPLRAQRSRDG